METEIGSGLMDGAGPFIQQFLTIGSQNPAYIGWYFFSHGFWIIVVIFFARALYDLWLDGRQGEFTSSWKYVLLAIDIPKNNEQTPKAVESIFAALAGAQKNPNLIEEHWDGFIQESFSFEIVSLEGYTQFLIRCKEGSRDLIEAAIYAQYPDAEITEVEDYAKQFADILPGNKYSSKIRFPNDEYDLWGTEFLFTKDYPYPIRTFSEFEHTMSQQLIDPMAGLTESLSRFGPGEQLWLQLVVTPTKAGDWGEKAKKLVKQMTGQDYVAPHTISDTFSGIAESIAGNAHLVVSEIFGGESTEVKKDKKEWTVQKLSPGEKNVLEKIQNKLSKHRMKFKFRLVYIGKKEVFNKGKGISSVVAAIQQFNTTDANAFKPGKRTKTAADYFITKSRIAEKQNKILRQYITRTNFYGEDVGNNYMSPEELATIWHFPVMTVKASQLEKIQSKKAAPPSRLPYHQRITGTRKSKETTYAGLGLVDDNDLPATPKPIVLTKPVAPFLPTMEEGSAPVKPVAPISPAPSPKPREEIKKIAPAMPIVEATRSSNSPVKIDAQKPEAIKRPAPPSNLPFV